MTTPMMRCGHAANATHVTPAGSQPSCVICTGITQLDDGRDPALVIDDDPPDLNERTAVCLDRSGGHKPVVSSPSLAFFRHRPDHDTDEYYCGHAGWD